MNSKKNSIEKINDNFYLVSDDGSFKLDYLKESFGESCLVITNKKSLPLKLGDSLYFERNKVKIDYTVASIYAGQEIGFCGSIERYYKYELILGTSKSACYYTLSCLKHKDFSYYEIANLDRSIINFIINGLEEFRNRGDSVWIYHGQEIYSNLVIGQILEGFYLMRDKMFDYEDTLTQEQRVIIRRSIILLWRYFGQLWI